MSNNTNDQILEQREKVQKKLDKVKLSEASPSRNSALILLQQAQGAATAGDIKKSRQLYAKAVECLELNLSYI